MKAAPALLALSLFACIAVPAFAGAPSPHDSAAMIQLSQLEARKAMLGMCGVTGDDAEKYLATDKEKEAKALASLSDDGKKNLPATLAQIDAGVKMSWEQTPEDQRSKSCDALKAGMAAGK